MAEPLFPTHAPLKGDAALIVQHCAVYRRIETRVRKFEVTPLDRYYSQYDRAVSVDFVEPRKRSWARYTMDPQNIRYLTIEDDKGRLLYDSRADVPCDMEKWAETRSKFAGYCPVVRVPAA